MNLAKEKFAEEWIAHWQHYEQKGGFPNNDVGSIEYDLPREHPKLCWDVIIEILSRIDPEPSNSLFQTLAAGMLEDLLANHGDALIEQVEEQARRDPHFNLLLGGVWQNTMTESIWARVQACRLRVW